MPEDGPNDDTSGGAHAGETLSCVSCRNRKLKCDRTKPRCNRCEKAKTECVYPESRRKPAFKRRNVKELEARLAQVEVLLKEAGHSRLLHDETDEPVVFQSPEEPVAEDAFLEGLDFTEQDLSFNDGADFSFQPDPTAGISTGNLDSQGQGHAHFSGGDLMDLGGIFESLPPFEMMEDLNRIFFERQQHLIPVIHPSRYLQAFYSAPHMKPPMCLQYAIWALAAHGHSKFNPYHDVFYRRARQYADSDEMKAYGEHFITVAHAQAWSIIATYEAKLMMFTRAAMSCARGVRLVEMMGLHRLDGAAEEMCPTLLPPRDWAELEERRRVFWGIFCIDSHCSISTGWPHLIDASEITTLLPASESAFHNGEQVETCSLHDAFKGQPYSSFAGAILVCHLFNQILKHVHKPKPNDNPDNYEYGEYWQRHRDIDNTLSSAFMYLPESFRLPDNYRDPIAVHTNLNLHASIICLHHSAIERIDIYKLPENVKKSCQDRLTTAAQEIVNIVKLTSHVNSSPRSPLAALSLYCAASVYVYLCKDAQAPTHVDNLDFIIAAMEALGRDHEITKAFLRQVAVDIERNDIQHIVRLPHLDNLSEDFKTQISHNIPLVARSSISRHSQVQPPLPGRLPLGKPLGKIIGSGKHSCEYGTWTSEAPIDDSFPSETRSTEYVGNNKRKRTAPSSGTSTLDDSSEGNGRFWAGINAQDRASSNPSTHSSPSDPLTAAAPKQPILCGAGYGVTPQQREVLPHRPSSHAADTDSKTRVADPKAPLSHDSSSRLGVNIAPHILGTMSGSEPGQSQTSKVGIGDWDLMSMCMNAQFDANGPEASSSQPHHDGNENDHDNIPWSMSGNEGMNLDWDAIGASLGIEPGGTAASSGLGPGPRKQKEGGTGFSAG